MLKLIASNRALKKLLLSVVFLCIAAAPLTAKAQAQTVPTGAPRQVNVTSDSTPGWAPSREQEEAAVKAATTYLALMDRGEAGAAYALLAEEHRRHLPYAEFAAVLARFNAEAGPVIERRQIVTNWTSGSPSAPVSGVYAAIDLVSRFEKIDRHCGYLILYQPPSGGAFGVMRQEDRYIANASATGSKAALDAAWATLSAGCPNYPGTQAVEPLPEQTDSTIGYANVETALAGLHKRGDVKFSTQNGWTIADDTAAMTLWSFAPPGHPAYPAAVKRQVVGKDKATELEMTVLCEADKVSCDALVRELQALNARIR